MAATDLATLLREAKEAIDAIGAGNPRLEAELLLTHALDRPRVFLFTHPEYQLTDMELDRFNGLLARRRSSEPLQYVLGTAGFRHLLLTVGPGVLIPRSETEILVEKAWEGLSGWAVERGPLIADSVKPWVIDVGAGSGAILLGLIDEALAGPAARASGARGTDPADLWFRPLAIDIAPRPLEITTVNAHANGLPAPHLLLADQLTAVAAAATVAAIVSNPPYISTAEMADLPAEIREYEPHEALHGGADGLCAIRGLLDQALPYVRRGTLLYFEIGAGQESAVRAELDIRGLEGLTRICADLAGRPRVVCVEPGGARGGG